MMRRVLLALAALAATGASPPPQLISDLSDNKIDIVYSFAGAEILVFGAIQYPGRTPDRQPDIAVIVRGPPQAITVRRKARVAGIWINTRAVRFETAPSYYAAATTRPVAALVDDENAAIYELGLDHLQLSPASDADAAEVRAFETGLIDLRRREGLYGEDPAGVTVTDNVLYRARVAIPSSVPVGAYTVEIHLIEDGDVVASTTREISIGKSGFERDVSVAAQQHSFSYGMLAVSLALILGWLAGFLVRR